MFKALSSQTRIHMLKLLLKEEMHISKLARKSKISVPVAAKHVRILEKAGLVERKVVGKSHVIIGKYEILHHLLDAFTETSKVELPRDCTVLDALKSTCEVISKTVNDKELLVSIDGKEGYYLYEVNGRLADIPMNQHKLRDKDIVRLKKLIPVTEKEIVIKAR